MSPVDMGAIERSTPLMITCADEELDMEKHVATQFSQPIVPPYCDIAFPE